MKKLLFIIASLLIAFVSVGQSIDNITTNVKLDVNENLTYFRYVGNAADTVGITDSTWTYTVGIKNLYDALKVKCRVELDSVSGSPEAACYLKGKDLYQEDWTTLTTVNWVTGAGDTTILLSYATAKPYRMYAIDFDAVADTTQQFKINEIEFFIYK